MKLEFLDLTDNGKNPDSGPEKLVRLYDYTDVEKFTLRDAIKEVVLNRKEPLVLHRLPYVDALNCKVTLVLAEEDNGLVPDSPLNEFTCRLTVLEYENMLERIELIDNGFNWLYGEGEEALAFLLSPGLGGW